MSHVRFLAFSTLVFLQKVLLLHTLSPHTCAHVHMCDGDNGDDDGDGDDGIPV